MILSWGKSASWLMPGLTKLAELENPLPPPPPIVTQRPREVYSWARVTQRAKLGPGTQGWSSWFRAPSQHAAGGADEVLEGSVGSECQGLDWWSGSWVQRANNQENQEGRRDLPCSQPFPAARPFH